MNESDMLQWLEELVEIPPEEDAALNELPDSFIWRRPLTRMTALTDPSPPRMKTSDLALSCWTGRSIIPMRRY